MVGTTLETGGTPFADEDGDISQKTRNWLDVVGSHVVELFQSKLAGQLVLDADPFTGVASCHVVYYGTEKDCAPSPKPCHGDCGWPPDEDMVEDDEAPDEPAESSIQSSHQNPEDQRQGTTERFRAFIARQTATKPGLPIERPLDVVRSDAGFTSGPIWIGGPGAYKGAHVHWSERDRGITHEQLMDACEGLSVADRRAAHVRAGEAATIAGRTPTVRDLLDALAVIRRRRAGMDDLQRMGQEFEDDLTDQAGARFGSTAAALANPAPGTIYTPCPATMAKIRDFVAQHDGSQLENAYDAPSSCGRSWDEAGSQGSHDAASCDPGCTHAPIRTEPVGWTTKPQVSNGLLAPGIWTGDNSGQTGTGEGYYMNHHVDMPAQEAKDGPNAVEPSLSADECETVSSASPAAPGGNPEDWRWVSPPEGELKSDIVEMEREIQALSEAHNLPRRMIAGDIGNNAEAEEFFSGIRGSGCPESDPEVTPDGIEIHHPVKCTGPMHIQADRSRDVWDIRASASVEAGGRFPAVDISAPIKD